MLLVSAGVLLLTRPASARNHGHKSYAKWQPQLPFPADALLSETLVAEERLPSGFDWRDVNGVNYVTSDWNQHIPQYCGSCWIHGTTSALSDRIKVLRGAKFPDVRLGRQSILNCVPDPEGGPPPGCNGGEAWLIHKYMTETKMPDETCMPYHAANMGCQADTICRNCKVGDAGCFPITNYIGYGVSSYGKVKGEKAMMKEIYARGPIVCSFATDELFLNTSFSNNVEQHEGVYITNQKKTAADIDHDMEITGWGETASGQKYWVVRNSWGTYWGQAGWFKLARGNDLLMSESDCDWAVPTWDGLDEALAGKVLGDYVQGIIPGEGDAIPIDRAASPSSNGVQFELALAGAFLTGVSMVMLAGFVARRAGVREQPFLLG